MTVYVHFYSKGESATFGGYVRTDTDQEKLEMTEYFKSNGCKVVWKNKQGEKL